MSAFTQLRDRNEHAASLACFASIASVIEPELLRTLRLALLPQADVSAEADLWWSRLVDLRTAASVRFAERELPELYQRLAADPAGLTAAYRLIRRLHRAAPDLSRLQEWLAFRALASPDHRIVTDLLRRILGTLLASGDAANDTAGWVVLATPRLPAALRSNPVFWSVVFAANTRGRGIALSAEAPPHEAMALPPGILASAGDVELIARRDGDRLLLRALPRIANPEGLLVPRIWPTVVAVHSEAAAQTVAIRPEVWSEVRVAGDASVVALDGRTYALRPTAVTTPPAVLLPQLAQGDFDRGIAVRLAFDDPETRVVVVTGRTGSARDTTIAAWYERAASSLAAGIVAGMVLEDDTDGEWRAFERATAGVFPAGAPDADLAQRIDANRGLLILLGIARGFAGAVQRLAPALRGICAARAARGVVAMDTLPDELHGLKHLVHVDLTEMDTRLAALLAELPALAVERWCDRLARFGDDSLVEAMLAAAELVEARPAPSVLQRWSDCALTVRAERAAEELGAESGGFATVANAALRAAHRDSAGVRALAGPLIVDTERRMGTSSLCHAITRRLRFGGGRIVEATGRAAGTSTALGYGAASADESPPETREPAVWIHSVSTRPGEELELIGAPAMVRGDLAVVFVAEPRLRPHGIYQVTGGRRLAATDENATRATGTRATCRRVLALPEPSPEKLDEVARDLEAISNSTSQRDTRNLHVHDRLIAVLQHLYQGDPEPRTALEYLLIHPMSVDAFTDYRDRRLEALKVSDAEQLLTARSPIVIARDVTGIALDMPRDQVMGLWRRTARASFAPADEGIGLNLALEPGDVDEIDRDAARNDRMRTLHEHLLHHPRRGDRPPALAAHETPSDDGNAHPGSPARWSAALDIPEPATRAAVLELKSEFDEFLSEIRPTQSQADDLKTGHTTLRRRLADDEKLSKIVVSDFLQGSYKRHTVVRPKDDKRSDVDIIVVTKLHESEFTPDQAMEQFRSFLDKHYKGKWRFQGRSIGIELSYVALDLVVTAVPSEAEIGFFKAEVVRSDADIVDAPDRRLNESWLAPESRSRTDAGELLKAAAAKPEWKVNPLRIPDRDAKKWDDTHPLEQIRWTVSKNALTNGHFVDVVKAIKWWRLENYPTLKHPKGFPLERMVGDCCPDGITSVAEGVVKTLECMVNKYRLGKPVLPDYGVPAHDVLARISTKDFATFYEGVKNAAPVARGAFDSSDRSEACNAWRELLGNKFPKRDDDGGSKKGEGFEEPSGPAVPGSGRFA